MVEREKRGKKIKKKLLHKYRLVILNESTYEEKLSFKLNRLNVFVSGMIAVIVLIGFTTLLIAFTPLREYIPGYSSTRLKREATQLTYRTDSLVSVLNYTNKYIENVRMVLRGDIENNIESRDSLFDKYKLDPSSVDLRPIQSELALRKEVELEEKYNIFERNLGDASLVLFPPIQGMISQGYDAQRKHFGVDVTAVLNSPVKAVANGTVVFSEWTSETGFVIILEHRDGLLSVYKHNSALSKHQGDIVRAGEVLAFVGNTGELTTGPHLHFELWNDGKPVDPVDFIDFN